MHILTDSSSPRGVRLFLLDTLLLLTSFLLDLFPPVLLFGFDGLELLEDLLLFLVDFFNGFT